MSSRSRLIRLIGVVSSTALLIGCVSQAVRAQSIWNKMKQATLQQECKDGNQSACQSLARQRQGQAQSSQQPQQAPKQQQPGAQPSHAGYQPASASAQPANGELDSSCCTADAMKKMAAAAGFLDVVGIKLGMTPQQAAAAIRAHNPALTLKQVTIRLAHPGVAGFNRVPHYIVAYNAEKPAGWEVIVVEFTTPPNAPVVAAISRFTNFEPTIVANLVNGLDKKYGEEYPRSGSFGRAWLFDQDGKSVTTQSQAADTCISLVPGVLPGGVEAGGSFTAIAQQNSDGPLAMDVDTYRAFPTLDFQATSTPKSVCTPYTWVWTNNLGTTLAPNSQAVNVTVTIGSGALAYAAERSTHDWLQAEADAKIKAAQDAASKRTGTTF